MPGPIPDSPRARRGRLHAHPEVTHWVVLDDLDLTWDDDSVDTPEVLQAHFVMTDPDTGMTAEDAKRAMQILEEPCRLELPPSRMAGEVPDTPGTNQIVMEDSSVPSTPEGVAAKVVAGELFNEVTKLTPLIDAMASTTMSPSTGPTHMSPSTGRPELREMSRSPPSRSSSVMARRFGGPGFTSESL